MSSTATSLPEPRLLDRLLPYLQIALLRPENTTVDFQNDQQRAQDVTTLEYAGEVSVLPASWP